MAGGRGSCWGCLNNADSMAAGHLVPGECQAVTDPGSSQDSDPAFVHIRWQKPVSIFRRTTDPGSDPLCLPYCGSFVDQGFLTQINN